MGRRKLTLQALGEQLGITVSAVSRLKSKGMPCQSLAKAQAWRERNLDPSRTKRPPPTRPPAREAARILAGNANGAALVAEVERLAVLAARDFDSWAPRLRSALRAVPDIYRLEIALPVPVARQLIGERALASFVDASGGPLDGLSNDETAELAPFWFALASGAMRFVG